LAFGTPRGSRDPRLRTTDVVIVVIIVAHDCRKVYRFFLILKDDCMTFSLNDCLNRYNDLVVMLLLASGLRH